MHMNTWRSSVQLAFRFDAFKQKCSDCYSWHSHIGKLIICRSFLRFLVGDNGQISRESQRDTRFGFQNPHGRTGPPGAGYCLQKALLCYVFLRNFRCKNN